MLSFWASIEGPPMDLEHSAKQAGIGDDESVGVDFDLAREVATDRLLWIASSGLQTRIVLPVGADGEVRHANIDRENLLRLARL